MNHQTRVYGNVLEMLSGVDNPTPLVRLNRVVPFKHATVYAKLEWYNPFGAVKDRVAANMVRDADEHGRLTPGVRLVEPTSGNTGMGLAMIANAKGYGFTATLSKQIPAEKRAALRMFGTEVLELDDELCPAPGAPEGAIALATDMGHKPGYVHLDQYKNPANPDAHYRTTGPEIWRQTDGKVTHFVAGLGTCGTITGTGRFLKEKAPAVKVLGVHPIAGHDIPGVRSLPQLKQTSLFFPDEYDALVEITNQEAFDLCRRLNQEESIIAGPSSAMALAGALRLVPDEPGVVCVVIFPDNVFKYTSSMRRHLPDLFKGSPESAGGGSKVNAALDNIVELAQDSPDVIDPARAQALLASPTPPVVIDVRRDQEFETDRLDGSINVPLKTLSAGLAVGLPKDLATPILTVCEVGKRSLYGMLLLKSLGHQHVMNIRGGLEAWRKAGLPTVTKG